MHINFLAKSGFAGIGLKWPKSEESLSENR